VQLGEQLHHRQAETRALELAVEAGVDLREWLEQSLEPLLGDADAVVAHADPQELGELAVARAEAAAGPISPDS
jgi:hypothetical protein